MAIKVFETQPHTFLSVNYGSGYTVVFIIPPHMLLVSVLAVSVRFAYAANDVLFDELWIGHQGAGDPYDFDGNQAKIQVGGSDSFTIDSDGIWSDLIPFSLDSSKPLLLAAYLATTAIFPRQQTFEPAYVNWRKTGNDASTTDKAGYAGGFWQNYVIFYREIIGTPAFKLTGTIKEKGNPVARTVRSFVRSTGAFFSESSSGSDGIFSVGAPNATDEMFVVAFDDDAGDQYNALVFDRVKGVPV